MKLFLDRHSTCADSTQWSRFYTLKSLFSPIGPHHYVCQLNTKLGYVSTTYHKFLALLPPKIDRNLKFVLLKQN